MKTDHAAHIRATSREFQNAGSAKTITDRRYLRRIDEGVLRKLFETGICTPAQERPIRFVFARFRARFLRVGRPNPFAVNVWHKCHIPESGNLFRASLRV